MNSKINESQILLFLYSRNNQCFPTTRANIEAKKNTN